MCDPVRAELSDLAWSLLLDVKVGVHATRIPGLARCGVASLAETARRKPRAVERALKQLEDRGLIIRDARNLLIFAPGTPATSGPQKSLSSIRGWLNQLGPIPDCSLRRVVIKELTQTIEPDLLSAWNEGLSEGPPGGPPGGASASVIGRPKEKEKERETSPNSATQKAGEEKEGETRSRNEHGALGGAASPAVRLVEFVHGLAREVGGPLVEVVERHELAAVEAALAAGESVEALEQYFSLAAWVVLLGDEPAEYYEVCNLLSPKNRPIWRRRIAAREEEKRREAARFGAPKPDTPTPDKAERDRIQDGLEGVCERGDFKLGVVND